MYERKYLSVSVVGSLSTQTLSARAATNINKSVTFLYGINPRRVCIAVGTTHIGSTASSSPHYVNYKDVCVCVCTTEQRATHLGAHLLHIPRRANGENCVDLRPNAPVQLPTRFLLLLLLW